MNPDVLYCKQVCKTYSTTYRNAIRFFPKKLRDEVTVLYAFFRLADEIVDNPTSSDPKADLQLLIDEWNGVPANRVLRAAKAIFAEHNIPDSYAIDFLAAMMSDTSKKRYANYAELEEYMYGSAVVVGYILSYVIGYTEGALPYAKKLAEAMQLTNFLRDVQEDYEQRDRIYFPEDEMARFGVTESMIAKRIPTRELFLFTQYQANRAQKLFEESYGGITMLNRKGRMAVYFAHDLYKKILINIIENNYSMFGKSYRLTKGQKAYVMIRRLLSINS